MKRALSNRLVHRRVITGEIHLTELIKIVK